MSFFDETYYIQSKLAQLKATGHKDANGNDFTADVVRKAITDGGMSVEAHYNSYGRSEGLNANAYFNENEYLHSKLKSLQESPDTAAEWAGRNAGDLKEMMGQMGISPAEHYKAYGYKKTTKDGCLLNPSNAFDANAYYAAKLAQLQTETIKVSAPGVVGANASWLEVRGDSTQTIDMSHVTIADGAH